jgi:hypothetical protein
MATLKAYLAAARADPSLAVGEMMSLRDYIGVTAAEDALLKTFFAPAIDWCHGKLSKRDFAVDPASDDGNPTANCVLAVYKYVEVLWDYHARASVLMKKIKTGGREEEYFEAGVAGRTSAAGLAAWAELEQSVLNALGNMSGGL